MHIAFVLETCTIVAALTLLFILFSKQLVHVTKSFFLSKYYFKS